MTKTEMLTHVDIRKFLENSIAAIELDQRRVDAMPAASFHHMYDGWMWRTWRCGHVNYVGHLLSSVGTIPPKMLAELSEVAVTYQTRVVERVLLEHLAGAVGGCSPMEHDTAKRFFGWIIKGVKRHAPARQHSSSAIRAIARWLPASDPLRISRDPECQYRLPQTR